ncbi:WD40/YVTN/BNR-like repeat-containing protein [Paraconexibacter sp.]|uniref:WD40/YVTN/BNR-like repeat-containing protein n=1 Tax=Paraconexibacter sp. TaxID=2949640 RepID=UPI00356A5BA5
MPRSRSSRTLLVLLLAVLLAPPAAAPAAIPSAPSTWYHLPGLNAASGAQWVRSITYSTDISKVYAGLEGGGVFRSTNGGISWSAFNAGFPNPATTNVRALLTSGVDTVFAGTDTGIWKSTNGGSWQPLAQGPEDDPANPKKLNGSVQSLASFPGNVMLAGVIGSAYGSGVYKSTDGGATWKPPVPGNGMAAGQAVYSIVGHPAGAPSFVLAASSDGVWRSTDMGSTWSLTSDGIPGSASPIQVWVDSSKPNLLYVSTASDGIYRSVNGGLTWAAINDGLGAVRARGFQIFTQAQGAHLYAATENALWHAVQTHENPPAGFLPKAPKWSQVTKNGLATAQATNEIMWSLTAPVIPGNGALGLIAGTQSDGGFFLSFAPPSTTCPNSTPATSNASNSACPSVNDPTPTPGDVLNVFDRGTWTGTPVLEYAYQWQRCTSTAENTCSDMDGEDELTYVVKESDTGKSFRAIVTVTNPAPTFSLFRRRTTVTSATAAAPATMPGYNQTNIPAISPPGSIAVGTTLTAFGTLPSGDGYFNPAATTRTWEWLRCTSSTDESTCTKIAGAGGAEPGGKSYTLKTADGTAYMRVRVKGTANGLSNELLSAATNPVISEPATATKAPSIFGDPYPGETLGSSVGAWKDPSTGFVRRWLQCDADGTACTQITKVATTDSEDGPTYVVRDGDLGRAIRLRVIADVNGDSDNEQDNFLPHAVEVETPALQIVPRPAPPGGGTPGGGTPGGGLPGGGTPGGSLPGGGLPGGGVGGTGSTPLPDLVRPVLSAAKLSRTRFALGKGRTAATARTGRGTTFRFRLSEPATVTIRITKPSAGRKVGKTCRAATRKLRRKPRCTYQRPMMLLTRRALAAGARSVPFTGRVGKKALRPGRYRATLVARDAAGNTSTSRRLAFRVVRR